MASIKISIISLLMFVYCVPLDAKVFGRCELAKALKNYGLPKSQIPTWVCIAKYESNFKTNAHNKNTGDHGIFQINEKYWCSTTSKPGKSCKNTCAKFRDDNIGDDVTCIKKIYAEHTRISGNGFNAWVAYKKHCRGNNSGWIKGCNL